MLSFIKHIQAKFLQLSQGHIIALLVLLSFSLALLTLNRGLQSDDYIQKALMESTELSSYEKLRDFYQFFNEPSSNAWWFDPDVKIYFFRPVSALSHALDYRLWPDNIKLMHLHSAIWYMLLVTLCFFLFQKILTNKNLAALASLIFCVDFSHFANLSWLANRNSLIAACFIVTSLFSYLHWHTRKANYKLYLLSALFFMLALLSSESSVALIGVLIIFEASHIRKLNFNYKHAIFSLLGFILIALLWLIAYQRLGFGSENNGLYQSHISLLSEQNTLFNSLQNIFSSLWLVASKLSVYLAGLFFGIEGFYNVLSSSAKSIASIICFSLLLILFIPTKALFKNSDLIFYALSCICFLILPSYVSLLDMRYGIFSSIFSALIIAILIKFFFYEKQSYYYHKALLIILITTHLIISPSQWILIGIRDWISPPVPYQQLLLEKEKHLDSDLFIIGYPKPIDAYYVNAINTGPNDDDRFRIHILSNNYSSYTLQNNLPESLTLFSKTGFIFQTGDFEKSVVENREIFNPSYAHLPLNTMRHKDKPIKQGAVFLKTDYGAEVISVNTKGLVDTIHFEFFDSLSFVQSSHMPNTIHSSSEEFSQTYRAKKKVFLEWIESEQVFREL